jgi:hypothetical protein
MKINLSNINDTKWLFSNNRAIDLLKKDNAPLIISFLYMAFKERNTDKYISSNITSILSDFLFATNFQKEEYSGSPKYYLDQWTNEGFLRQYYEAKNDEASFELTPSSELAIRWLSELNKSESAVMHSRLLQVFNMLKALAIAVTEDKEKKVSELEKEKKEIQTKIENVYKELDYVDPIKIKESFLLIEESALKLMSDFKQVEENFRNLNREAREEQIRKPISKGELLDHVFQAQDAIIETPQGKSFRSFWEFLMDQSRQRELEYYIEEIFKVPELSNYKHSSLIPRLKMNLVDAGDRVNRTTDELVEQLRKFMELKIYLENKRVAEIISGIEELAIELKNNPPTSNDFIEIDGKPKVSIVMNRELFKPPHNPEINSAGLEEGVSGTDTSILFEQLYVDPELLKANIKRLLKGSTQISLKEITEKIPIQKGLTEVVTYFSIASGLEKEKKSVITPEEKETIVYYNDGRINEITLPKTIFLS